MSLKTLPTTLRARPRLRLAGSGLALGIFSVLTVGVSAAPAASVTSTPTVTSHCRYPYASDPNSEVVSQSWTGFPTGQEIRFVVYWKTADGKSHSFDVLTMDIDENGAGTTRLGTSDGLVFGDPPVYHSFVAYRDLNGNGHWNSDKDDTVYRGEATITRCPQDVVLSPK